MNNMLGVAVVAVLIALGGGTFLLMNSDGSGPSDGNSSQLPGSANYANSLGVDTSSLNGSYRVTVTANEDNSETTAVIDSDGSGNTRISATDNGATSVILSVGGATYVQNPDGGWLKFPAGSDSASTNDFEQGFSAEDINNLSSRATVVYMGTGNCTAGNCRVYQSTDNDSGDTAIFKIDTQTNRLSDLLITSASGDVTTIVYDFTAPIHIAAPEGAVEFDTSGV